MKCDVCGEDFEGKAAVDTHSVGPSTKYHGNSAVWLTMCPACAALRGGTQRTFVLALGLLIGGLVVAALFAFVVR